MRYVLYGHPLSSCCQKVAIAFNELGIGYASRIVNLGDPAQRAEFEAMWPTARIPLLADLAADRVIPETSIMIEYVDRRVGESTLLPKADDGADDALDARLWDRVVDCYLMTPMQKIVGDQLRGEQDKDPCGVAQARQQIIATYAMLDRRLSISRWLVGDAFSIADCGAAPALFFANTLVPIERSVPALLDYFERLLERESVRSVMAEARPYLALYPFADKIPARFR